MLHDQVCIYLHNTTCVVLSAPSSELMHMLKTMSANVSKFGVEHDIVPLMCVEHENVLCRSVQLKGERQNKRSRNSGGKASVLQSRQLPQPTRMRTGLRLQRKRSLLKLCNSHLKKVLVRRVLFTYAVLTCDASPEALALVEVEAPFESIVSTSLVRSAYARLFPRLLQATVNLHAQQSCTL